MPTLIAGDLVQWTTNDGFVRRGKIVRVLGPGEIPKDVAETEFPDCSRKHLPPRDRENREYRRYLVATPRRGGPRSKEVLLCPLPQRLERVR